MVSMPYMENGSLADTLHNGQSDDTWKATTIAGIVTGMKYLHTKEFYRGNLIPNNILINKEGHPQISDYLCHRLSKSRIISKNKEDDILYVAPELINDSDGRNTQKADIYSFAVILYEIIVGHEIFSEKSKSLILNGKRPEIPNTIDPVINEIISKCWSAKPSERFEFSDIYSKLKSIDLAITKNVDVNIVKEYIDSVFDARKMTVNVRLWDGSLHQIDVCLDGLVYGIRQGIGEYANIPVDQVILGRNESPFFCCWSCGLNQNVSFEYALDKMDDKRNFLNDRIIDLVVRITAVADKYPTFQNKLNIRMFPTNETENNVTTFYMKPGKVSDMIKKNNTK
ncbi:hypothetical protein M9Y10_032156 [Tritrichomonas musculus]|uniref:Protein kinase domain-containing protein n=1 Tax=Tritrichomonas musculus TaxID=1915356 RepID=A0ABR2GZ54_9EUKA